MNITELNQAIINLESAITLTKGELDQCKKLSDVSFAFMANWRDKASFAKRIPLLEKQLGDMNNKLVPLKSEKALIEKQLLQEKEIKDAKDKVEEDRIINENKIVNPIMSMDVK